MPVLLHGLRHPNDDLRIQSSQILTNYAAMEQVAQAMRSLADDPCVEVRRNALVVLASYLAPDAPNIGPTEKTMAAAAALFLADKEQEIRVFAVKCLEWSNYGAAPLARALVRCEERLAIAQALANERKDSSEATPILRPLLDDPVRWRAACIALACIAPDEHFACMLAALEKFEPESAGLFEYPREIRSRASRLVAALVKDARQPAKQSQAVRGLAAIFPMLPPPQKSDLHRLMPLWRKLLDGSVKVLESKNGDHRGAIRAIFDLHRLTDEMLEPIEFPTSLNEQERNAVLDLSLAIKASLDQARSNSDLQVRRVARRAQMEQPGRREFGGRRRVARPD